MKNDFTEDYIELVFPETEYSENSVENAYQSNQMETHYNNEFYSEESYNNVSYDNESSNENVNYYEETYTTFEEYGEESYNDNISLDDEYYEEEYYEEEEYSEEEYYEDGYDEDEYYEDEYDQGDYYIEDTKRKPSKNRKRDKKGSKSGKPMSKKALMRKKRRRIRIIKRLIVRLVLLALVIGGICALLQTRYKGIAVLAEATDMKSCLECVGADSLDADWVKNGTQCYYYKGGVPVTGWQKIDGATYYFDKNGLMATNEMVEKNKFVDKDGKLIDPSEIYGKGVEGLAPLKTKLQEKLSGYSGTWSVYVKNLDTNEYVSLNDMQIKSASLIKLYNMVTVYHEIEKGNVEQTSSVNSMLHAMITVSDNAAFNHLLPVIGDGNTTTGCNMITNYCQELGFADTGCGGTLSSAETGVTPVWMFTNYTSAKDCGHLLENIYRGVAVSENASEEMLSLLKKQEHRAKIPGGLPEGVVCANKTGEYGAREHDAAIIFSDGADYILTVMTDGDPGSIGHIQSVSNMVYHYFNDGEN